MKILVAEDNAFYRRMLTETLRGWTYEVLTAGNGEEAWEILQAKDGPRLAIVDWMMPKLNGVELCRRVRSTPVVPPTYLILLTAKGGKDNLLAGLEAGADDYIHKPFDRDELHAHLRVGLRIVGLHENLAAKVHELENALSGAQKMEAIGRLAGGVAHDFNNLLTAISGGAELLERLSRLEPQQREFTKMIKGAAERGTALTRQLLAFSRKQILQPEIVHLNTLVSGLEKILLRLIGEDIELSSKLESGLASVKADPGQLEQVVMNLVVNARDAMPSGGRITIETRNITINDPAALSSQAAAGSYVMLGVTDTGCGMNEETKAHIFEPFFTTKEPGKGTGLGLATVYGIVKQSAGFIQVDSTPGFGTTFRIYFPRVQEAQPTSITPEKELKPASKGETILLVEDDETVRRMVRQTLELDAYKVLEACDGTDAMRVQEECREPIHLLLTDLVMPRLGGNQLAESLAPVRPNMKVLFMSGYTSDAFVHRSIVDSGRPFLQKPFTPRVLQTKVREVLGN